MPALVIERYDAVVEVGAGFLQPQPGVPASEVVLEFELGMAPAVALSSPTMVPRPRRKKFAPVSEGFLPRPIPWSKVNTSSAGDTNMKRWLQSFLLGLYRVVQASGLLSTRWGGGIFEWAYHRYKRLLEAGDIRVLAACIKPGAVVIDVGANIGFFTKFFGERVSAGGRVIAIEPEAANFARLNQMICACGLSSVVETIQAVAADRSGTLRLAINRAHPADHKIAAEGVPVTALALDTLLAEHQWPSVCLIKVDVQGAEAKVLGGAQETVRRFHPALFLEVDDEALRAMQSEATGLFRELVAQGYHIHRIVGGKISPPMKIEEAVEISRGGKYGDFLLLHVAADAATSTAA